MYKPLHDHIDKLRIISKIKSGDKLNTVNDFSIHKPILGSSIIRTIYQEGKQKTITYINDLFISNGQFIIRLLEDIKNEHEINKLNQLYDIVVQFANEIRQSISGISELSKTYNYSQETTAKLEGIINDFAIPSYKELLSILPKEISDNNKNLFMHIEYADKRINIINNISPIITGIKTLVNLDELKLDDK